MDKPKINPTIIGQVGHSFDIILESMVGSTGYGWCLKAMPDGIELISTEDVPVKKGIAPTRQIFTFAALKPMKNKAIEFELLCLYNLSQPAADKAIYEIEVHDVDENDVLKKEIGVHKFLRGSSAMVHAKPIPPYGFTDPGKIIPLYGFPPNPLYGYPVSDFAPSIIASQTNCLVKYGNPFGVAVSDAECNLKYGYPVVKYGYPPIYKYGFPMSNAQGETIKVKADAKNCVVKYGTPFGVANSENECTLKYGFPVTN